MRGCHLRLIIQAGGIFFLFPACSLNVEQSLPVSGILQPPPPPTVEISSPRKQSVQGPWGGAMALPPPQTPFIAPMVPAEVMNDLPKQSTDPRARRAKVSLATMGKHGEYGMNAVSQRAYLQMMLPGILDEMREDFSIYDLGCADGINSMMIMSSIRKEVSNFTVGFVDVPENDWDTARFILGAQLDRIGPDTGFIVTPQNAKNFIGPGGAAGALMAGDFYGAVAPDNSYDLAYSGTAVHLLSDANPAKQRQTAAKDWLNFLTNRARELKSGGTLHVTAMARRDYQESESPAWSYMSVYKVLQESIKRAVQRRFIGPKAASAFSFPCYSRSTVEWKEPFDADAVEGLNLESFQLVSIASPYWKIANETPSIFATLYVPSVMAWLGPYMERELGIQSVQLFTDDLRENIMHEPHRFVNDYLEAVMKIRKS